VGFSVIVFPASSLGIWLVSLPCSVISESLTAETGIFVEFPVGLVFPEGLWVFDEGQWLFGLSFFEDGLGDLAGILAFPFEGLSF